VNAARRRGNAAAAWQMAMAKNIGQLKTKEAKQMQAHMLCESLKRTIRGKA
jgi:hypothetical protein